MIPMCDDQETTGTRACPGRAASIQDRDAAKPLLRNLKQAFPAIRLAWCGPPLTRKR